MRSLEFTRLLEDTVTTADLPRINSGKPVDPAIQKGIEDLEKIAQQDPEQADSILKYFQDLYSKIKSKVSASEDIEVLEDNQTAIGQYADATMDLIAKIMSNPQALQALGGEQEIKTIKDSILTQRAQRIKDAEDVGDKRATERLNQFLTNYDTSIDGLVDKIMESERQWVLANQDATTKKAQKEMATKEKNIDAVKRTIGGIFSGKLFKAGTLTDKQIQEKLLAFLIQAKDGIINWGKVLQAGKDKTANVDTFVPKEFKEIYLLFRKELFAVRPETTAGSWGPGEVGLILIGNPITKAKEAGDLQDKVTGDKFELKASNDPKKGGRLSPPGLGTSKMAPRFDRVKLKHFGKGFQAKFGENSSLNKDSLNQTFIKEYNEFIDKGLRVDSKEFLKDCIMAAFTDNVPTDKELEPYVGKMTVNNKIDYNGFVRTYAKFLFDRYQGSGDDKKFKNIIVFNPGSTTYTVLDGSDDLDSEFVVITGGIEFGGSQVPKSPQIGIA